MQDVVPVTPELRAAAKKLGYELPVPPVEALAHLDMLGGFFALPWTKFYDMLKPGTFVNVPLLAWVAPDLFRFLQPADPDRQFLFRRFDGREIRPRAMDTDGGSVPWAVTGVDGFSKWGFAPAFLVHDWLYVAHKCAGVPDDTWGFHETAILMAECMKTLIVADRPALPGRLPNGYRPRFEPAPRTVYLMYEAVASPFARAVFDDFSTATCYADPDVKYAVDFRPLP